MQQNRIILGQTQQAADNTLVGHTVQSGNIRVQSSVTGTTVRLFSDNESIRQPTVINIQSPMHGMPLLLTNKNTSSNVPSTTKPTVTNSVVSGPLPETTIYIDSSLVLTAPNIDNSKSATVVPDPLTIELPDTSYRTINEIDNLSSTIGSDMSVTFETESSIPSKCREPDSNVIANIISSFNDVGLPSVQTANGVG